MRENKEKIRSLLSHGTQLRYARDDDPVFFLYNLCNTKSSVPASINECVYCFLDYATFRNQCIAFSTSYPFLCTSKQSSQFFSTFYFLLMFSLYKYSIRFLITLWKPDYNYQSPTSHSFWTNYLPFFVFPFVLRCLSPGNPGT